MQRDAPGGRVAGHAHTLEPQESFKKDCNQTVRVNAFKATHHLSCIRLLRSNLLSIKNIVQKQQDESQKQLRVCEETILRIIENRQKEHDLQIQGANSQFTDTLAAKDEEIRCLHETIEEKEACIMRMSENLTLKQSDFAKARQQHNDDALQLSEMEKKYFVAKQQVHALSQNELKLQNENRIVRDSLNQELETSEQLKREASVMEGNFRRIETENERLQKLTNKQELDIRRIEGMLSEWSQKLTDSKSSTDSLQWLVLNAIKAAGAT